MLRGDEMAQTMDRLQRSAALLAILGMFLLAGCGNAPTGTAVAVLPNGISAPTATWTRTDTATPVEGPHPHPRHPLPSCGVDAFQDYQRLLCAPAEVTEGKVQSEWLRWCLGHYGYALTEPAAAELPLVTASLPDGQCIPGHPSGWSRAALCGRSALCGGRDRRCWSLHCHPHCHGNAHPHDSSGQPERARSALQQSRAV